MKRYVLADGSKLFVHGEIMTIQVGIAEPYAVTASEVVPLLLQELDEQRSKETARNQLEAVRALQRLKEIGSESEAAEIVRAFVVEGI